MTAPLKIEIAKRADGAGVLSCIRPDGSRTWQKQKSTVAPHFALHDLTHYAVETTLAYRRGFFGLIQQGWDIDDTTGKGSKGVLPNEAVEVERIVGLFDMERASGSTMTLAELNAHSLRPLSGAEFEAIRNRRRELFERWREVASGDKLELLYPI